MLKFSHINSVLETLAAIRTEMDKPSSALSEYETVMSLYGVGRIMCSRLIAEVGDVRRFKHSESLVAIAGIDPPPNQSGKFDANSRSISKRRFPLLRKTLFQITQVILQKQPANEPVYQFLDRKRPEGKPYKVYMIATVHKFLTQLRKIKVLRNWVEVFSKQLHYTSFVFCCQENFPRSRIYFTPHILTGDSPLYSVHNLQRISQRAK